MLKFLFKIYFKLIYRPYVERKLRRTGRWNYRNLRITVFPGVFHPRYFYSSRYMAAFLEKLDLTGTSVLEAGCGSGFLSVLCASRGARVTAFDINAKAVENCRFNAEQNKVEVNVFQSDLFGNCEDTTYDLLLVNPPFFASYPSDMPGHAWYCGENFEYFHRFFMNYFRFVNHDSEVIMVLSQVCNIDRINEIAVSCGSRMKVIRERRFLSEKLYLYSVKKTS